MFKSPLMTAVLMTMAAMAWVFNAFFLRADSGVNNIRMGVAILFVVLAIVYWVLYFRRRNTAAQNISSGDA